VPRSHSSRLDVALSPHRLEAFSDGVFAIASTHGHRLVEPGLAPALIRRVSRVILAAPVVYAVAVLIGSISPRASVVVYLLVPLAYVVPGPIDRAVGTVTGDVPAPPGVRHGSGRSQ
jgi:hypothetical protein